MNKRIISMLVTFTLIFTSISVDVSANDIIYHTSGNYKYTILEDGTAEISGYIGSDSVVDIPTTLDDLTVTSIGSEAFINTSLITEVTIPDTVKIIGFRAFYGCAHLSKISIPDTIETVSASSFGNTNYYYNEANWENGVLYLEYIVLFANKKITSCIVKPGTRVIASSAFSECHILGSIELPDGLEIVEWLAFDDCIMLRKVSFPSSIRRIGNYAFTDCSNLTDISIPDNDLIIEDSAFENTAYTNNSDNYVDGVLYIDNHMISCQYSTRFCNIREGTRTIADSTFSNCVDVIEINIPYGVTRIGNYAFAGCDNLDSIVIPNTVTCLGEGAFYGCWNLTEINLSQNITEIKDLTFSHCGSLKTVNFNGSRISYIGKEAFERCHALEKIELPDSVEIIDDSAFLYCELMNYIVLPKSLRSIGDQAFDMCYFLELVFYKGGSEERFNINISYYKNDPLLHNAAWHYNASWHTLETKIVQPTCYTYGSKTIACSQCDYREEENIKPFSNHSWYTTYRQGSCTEPSDYVNICKICGEDNSETYPATGHRSDGGIVTKKATIKETGLKTYTCLTCKNILKTQVIPKKISIKKAKFSLKVKTYTGKAIKQSFKVKLGSKTLKKGKDYTVSYKNNKKIGKATVTITGIGNYAGTKKVTFAINPKKVSSLKVKSGKKHMTVSWKKDKSVGGYEILYATSKNFKKGNKTVKIKSYKTAKKIIKKLKAKKTYYVKVRSFKKVGGKTYYGAYASVKKVKIK